MEKIKGFKNCNILVGDNFQKTSLIVKNEKIVNIGNCQVDGMIELDNNLFVIPGFIDEHIHGAMGSDAMDGNINALENIANALASEGTTAFLATTMTQSDNNIIGALKNVAEYIKSDKKVGAKIVGAHLEGPFISKDYVGAQPIEYVQKPDIEVFKSYQKASNNNIKIVTLAPEEDGAIDLIEYLVSNNIVASIGHTNAKCDDCANAIKAGARCVTHTFNAQRGVHHRDIGTAGSAMLFDELSSECICDGIHVSPQAIRLLVKNKPNDKFILVTDSLRAKHLPDGISEIGGQKVIIKGDEARLENGALAASMLKMNKGVANLCKFLNKPLEKVVMYATKNPALNLGVFDQMGSIEVGKCANFVVVDKDVNVYMTIRDGNIIYKK